MLWKGKPSSERLREAKKAAQSNAMIRLWGFSFLFFFSDLNAICLISKCFSQWDLFHFRRGHQRSCLLKYTGCALVKMGPKIPFVTNFTNCVENLLKNLVYVIQLLSGTLKLETKIFPPLHWNWLTVLKTK